MAVLSEVAHDGPVLHPLILYCLNVLLRTHKDITPYAS